MRDGALDRIELWEERAEQARKLAEGMSDSISMRIMLQIARDYDYLAQRARDRRDRKEGP